MICNGCPVTEDGARHPLPADEQFTKDTLLDVDAFWDAFHTPWINQFTGTAHRLYAARLFDGVRYPVGLLHEDYYVLPDLIAHCSAVYCMAFTGYYVLRHAGSITDGARHEVRLATATCSAAAASWRRGRAAPIWIGPSTCWTGAPTLPKRAMPCGPRGC